jgi:hypothetical protein
MTQFSGLLEDTRGLSVVCFEDTHTHTHTHVFYLPVPFLVLHSYLTASLNTLDI